MKLTSAIALSLVLGVSATPLIASAAGDHGGSHSGHGESQPVATTAQPSSAATAASSATTNSNAMTDGEIKKVDKDAGKLTIKHAELKNLDMPAMTMVFQVQDKVMLDQVKTGDKVSFVAEKVDGKFTVTQLNARQ